MLIQKNLQQVKFTQRSTESPQLGPHRHIEASLPGEGGSSGENLLHMFYNYAAQDL